MASGNLALEVEEFAFELDPAAHRQLALACVEEMDNWVSKEVPHEDFLAAWRKAVGLIQQAVADSSVPSDLEALCDQMDDMPRLLPDGESSGMVAFCSWASHALYCAFGVLGGLIEPHTPVDAALRAADIIIGEREAIEARLRSAFEALR